MRLHADFDNYIKKAEKEKVDFAKSSKASLILNILPILDQFELGLQQKNNAEEFRHGMDLVYKNLFSTLKKEGLEEMDLSSGRFDPYLHEAVKTEEGEDGKILAVVQKGYLLNGKVLRHAKVIIGRKSNDNKNEKN